MTTMSRAVIDNRLMYVSASAIDTFLLCAKKWTGIYVFGHREAEDPGSSSALGSWGHKLLEDAILTGVEPGYTPDGQRLPPFEDGRRNVLVMSLELVLSYMMDEFDFEPGSPKEGIEIEQAIEKTTNLSIAGTRAHGRIDFADFSNTKHPRIGDLKTTSSLSNALSEAKLRKKTQVVVYANYALARCPDAEQVTLEYIYANANQDKPPKIRVVRTTFTREEAEEALRELEPVVSRMQEHARTVDLNEVEAEGWQKPVREACLAFNKECHIKTAGLCSKPFLPLVPADEAANEVERFQAALAKRRVVAPAEDTTGREAFFERLRKRKAQ